MRILVVSDLHYSLRQLDWVSTVSEKFDLVIIAGDLLDLGSAVDMDTQILVVLKYFSRIQPRTPLLVSSGNHDITGEDPAGERAARWLEKARRHGVRVDWDRYDVGDHRFTICPWWEGPAGRTRVEAQLEKDAQDRPAHWIWIHHAPPQDRPVSWTGKTHFGDPQVGKWINQYQPDLVFSGHVHQSPFRNGGSWVDKIGDTLIFNAGFQVGPVPTSIMLDTEARTAVWVSQMGKEMARLDGDLAPREEMEIG